MIPYDGVGRGSGAHAALAPFDPLPENWYKTHTFSGQPALQASSRPNWKDHGGGILY